MTDTQFFILIFITSLLALFTIYWKVRADQKDRDKYLSGKGDM